MTTGASQAAPAAEDFSDVFKRDDHDSGADPVAPDAGQPRDDFGRFAPKQTDAQPQEPQPQLEQQPASPDRQDADANRHVPLKELLSERDRYKAEKKQREDLEFRLRSMEEQNRAFQQLLLRSQQQPAQQQQAPQPPDPYADPQGYQQYVHQYAQQIADQRAREVENRFSNRWANFSERRARKEHGDDVVNAAVKWAGDTNNAAYFMYQADDPYGDLVSAYQRASLIQEVGPNVSEWRKKVEAEVRAKVLAELKAGGNQPPQRFPGSLASATPTGTQGAHLSPEAAFADIFDTNRDRRKY